ncbi:mitochondrial import inner membrane translocase subunit Tim13 [Lepeophtheirus salmonis]|uniref:Mitochondrial import inner membrane translocase subunit n=2 Tax=Lepeophtheirus salmonis TaxID=72036 RepID=D3PJK7_LEPSM|nr:mitochondrial import inner membrane translocase subunit tim-13-like [Lepeophtheirus salmonis]ADD38743.1 Mitochondrial import inner membrane translocase subunit tim-13 [Lepeophtheirus salmonis]
MDPEALNKLSPQQKSEIMQSVKTQAALANMQMLLTQVTDKCFPKCISSPSTSLSSSEQKCLSMCMDRFMDSFNVVSRAYTNKLKNEASFQ